MATSQLNNIKIFDPLTILTTAESSAIVVPSEALVLWISSDTVVHLRAKSGENGFRIPANTLFAIDCATWRTKSIYIHNATAGTAVVSVMFESRTSE